ncbi:MAG: acyltransferase [Bacteroidia bacterium]|nr:acyltransferase [Bacteroidia bacterium]
MIIHVRATCGRPSGDPSGCHRATAGRPYYKITMAVIIELSLNRIYCPKIKTSIMIVGYIQNSPRFGEKKENFSQITAITKGIKADLLVLPELFATGYAFASKEEANNLAETPDGITAGFLKQLSAETGAILVGGFIELEDDQIFNSAIMVFDDEVIGTYRKIHLFNKEKIWFSAGNKPIEVYELNGMKIGMMICFDWIFPEVMRTLTLKGAQIIAHPSNLVMPYCQSAMVTRCLENRIFAVTANRIGRETREDDDFIFTGKSQITCVNGNILSTAPTAQLCVNTIDIDIHHADNKSINPFNDLLKDRREEFYT